MNERVIGLLARPFGWLLFQLAQILVLGTLLRLLVPDGWSRSTKLAVVLPVLVLAVIFNYRLRRRLPPFFETPQERSRGDRSGDAAP